jgi:hypothetical protein
VGRKFCRLPRSQYLTRLVRRRPDKEGAIMALLPAAQIDHDEQGWHVCQGDIRLDGLALPPLLERLTLTLAALESAADLDQPLRRDTDWPR